MKTIVLASANKHKVVEIKNILSGYNILSLSDIGFTEDIAETGTTLQENAKIKAEARYMVYSLHEATLDPNELMQKLHN